MEIFYAVLIVTVIGIITGFGLSVASELFKVPKDEKEEQIRACLPGANCGACGYSGCDGYAAALAKGEAKSVSQCAPGGNDVAKQLSALLGVEAANIRPLAAVVRCGGDCTKAQKKLEYVGEKSCKAAAQLFGGHKSCLYGCLGFGDCVKACPYEAIRICDGIAHVDTNQCRACRACEKVCPKNLIELLPKDEIRPAVLCRNQDKAQDTHKQCSAGCIGCGKCMRNCEFGAITVESFVAHVDQDKCTGCGKCAENCPIKCITMLNK